MVCNEEGCCAPPNSLNLLNKTELLGTSSVSSASINCHRSPSYMEMMPAPEPPPLTIQTQHLPPPSRTVVSQGGGGPEPANTVINTVTIGLQRIELLFIISTLTISLLQFGLIVLMIIINIKK
uniref:Uncharacterized protein n=1 Tax=Bombyx mori TaxID=7091 RepID=A0A8R2MA62_BOMMO|nr:uncharacterized protein LOC119630753 [Bombyx mori]